MPKGDRPETPLIGCGRAMSGALALHKHIVAHRTATLALLSWCVAAGIGYGDVEARVIAQSWPERPAGVAHRRVQLERGNVPLCAAEIWFRPAQLTLEMRETLIETSTPFGAVIEPLGPRRITTFARAVNAFATDIEMSGIKEQHEVVLQHRATVLSGGGVPIARTRENFLAGLVANIPGDRANDLNQRLGAQAQ